MTTISNKERSRFYQGLESLFDAPSTTQDDLDSVLNSILSRPNRAPVQNILPTDEIDKRLLLAAGLGVKEWRAIEVAILMAIPIRNLRELASGRFREVYFEQIRLFVRMMLRKGGGGAIGDDPSLSTPKSRNGSASGSEGDSSGNTEERQTSAPQRSKRPNDRERAKCLDRDHFTCIAVHTSQPEACHIVPFAINSIRDALKALTDAGGFFQLFPGPEPVQDRNLLIDHLACSDKSWNMLSLNRQMHKWWVDAMFAFKCLGITPGKGGEKAATIQLQFHWMPQRSKEHHWARPINLANGEAVDMVREWKQRPRYGTRDSPPGVGHVAAVDVTPCRLLQIGHVLELRMPLEEAEKMKAMINLQWASLHIASMSGAPDWDDFFEPLDDDLYGEALWDSVTRWIGEMQPGSDDSESILS